MKLHYVCGDRGIAPDGTKGASIHLRSLAAAFRTLGHEVTLFTRRPGAGPSGVEVVPLTSEATLYQHAAEHGHPDVILERYSLGHEAGLDAARRLGVDFMLEVNAPLVEEAARYRGVERDPASLQVEHRLLREADVVVCVSEPLASYVAERRGRREGVAVVHNGHDPRCFRGIRDRERSRRSDARTLRVGFLGHPKPWHGADRLPRWMARLEKLGVRAELVVIGGGAIAEALLESADLDGMHDRITVTGALSHTRAIEELSRCDVSVAPYPASCAGSIDSHARFFYFCPIKVIESMAAGVPVVASDLGDIAAILGGGGVVVSAEDDGAFVAALARLAAEEGERSALAESGQRRAREELTWERAARKILDLRVESGAAPEGR